MRRESLLLRVFLAICIGAFAAAEEGHGTCSEASACAGSTEVALVTGANVGLGMHTALQLAAKGVFVYASMRNVATGDELMELAKARQVEGRIFIIPLDVTDKTQIEAAVDVIMANHGRVDIVVHNAGVLKYGSVWDISEDDIRKNMEVNFFGPFLLTKQVLPIMKAQGGGRIVYVSSVSGRVILPFHEAYTSTKAAAAALLECFAPTAAMDNISVTVVEPGPTASTNLFAKGAARVDMDSEYMQMYRGWAAANVGMFAKFVEEVEEGASVIVKAATMENPPVYVPTSAAVEFLVGMSRSAPLDGAAIRDNNIAQLKQNAVQPPSEEDLQKADDFLRNGVLFGGANTHAEIAETVAAITGAAAAAADSD